MSFWISYCGNMTSYRFFKMAAAVAQYYFRFRIFDVLAFRRSKSINKPNFVDINGQHINLWLKYNDFWFGKTNVHLIGILLPVLISTTSRNFHVILHHAAEFRPNRSTHCKNMTSFPFFKMAAATAKYQFLFCIC